MANTLKYMKSEDAFAIITDGKQEEDQEVAMRSWKATNEEENTMEPFTLDRYELREGRFIIVPTTGRQYCGKVTTDFTGGSEDFASIARSVRDSSLEHGEDYDPYIFEGFIVVDRYDDRSCIEVLFGMDRAHAEARLAEMKEKLEAEIQSFINLQRMIAGEDEENDK